MKSKHEIVLDHSTKLWMEGEKPSYLLHGQKFFVLHVSREFYRDLIKVMCELTFAPCSAEIIEEQIKFPHCIVADVIVIPMDIFKGEIMSTNNLTQEDINFLHAILATLVARLGGHVEIAASDIIRSGVMMKACDEHGNVRLCLVDDHDTVQ